MQDTQWPIDIVGLSDAIQTNFNGCAYFTVVYDPHASDTDHAA